MNNYLLITGASSGIGRQCAIQLSEKYNLILCARREDKLQETRRLCQNPEKHLIFVCDLSDIDNLEDNIINFLKEKDITISKFLHCAGTMGMMPIKTISSEFLLNCLKIHIISPTIVTKTLIKKSINHLSLDNIVFISSINSLYGERAFCAYGASKSGLDGLMRNMAVELSPKIRVNSICVGLINDGMGKNATENNELKKHISSFYPLGLGSAHNIADVVEFLFSDKASWITGQQIIVDGGRSINISG